MAISAGAAVNAGARLDRLPISSFHYRIFWLVGAGMFFDGYDLYVAGGVLAATIQTKFSTLPQNLQFLSLTFVGMTLGSLVTGFIGDRFGRRFTYQVNLLIFGLASLAAALAQDMTQLIACRFVQGLGLGAEIVVGYSTLTAGLRGGATDDNRRKRAVAATLREAEEKAKLRKNRAKPSLLVRMRQANIGWSKNTYYLVSVAVGIAASIFFMGITGLGTVTALAFGFSAALLLPHWYVKFKRTRRFKRFSNEFPNAIDIIVRGIKAGLPLGDCLKVIASETQEPVNGEFKTLIKDQSMGLPVDEAVQRLPDRIPLVEASLFAIVIAIQSRTGGNLSEALGNLSRVLRERKKMEGKIKAMSGEAKASALIIAILPFAVIGVLYFTSPDYIALLFSTQIGKIVLVACGLMMVSGTLTMRKMINFDF